MRNLIVGAGAFALGWLLYRAVRDLSAEDEIIRDPSHELGSSTGM